LNRSEMRAYS